MEKPKLSLTRRSMLKTTAAAAAGWMLPEAVGPLFAGETRRFQIGACDWSIGKLADVNGIPLAKAIGLDGLQVSLGTVGNDMHLRKKEVQEQYKNAAAKEGVKVASLAIGELNNIPYKSDPRTIQWVSDSIDVCRAMDARVVLLAFFGNGDLRNDPAGVNEVVRRLKEVAPKAEKAGVVLGIESWLSADQHLEIIDRVGSRAVQVYYDLCNSNDRGYDIYKEIRQLGKQQICEFHAKENGALLGKGKIDFPRVREALDDIGYTGWLQIEGAIPEGGTVLESYKHNCSFLRKILA